MKYLKQMCCFLIVVLVIVTGSCVTISSVACAEETPATAPSPAVSDSDLASLEAQAAATGIGVRTMNGVKVFHTKDGQDLEMIKMCNGDDAVKDQGGEFVSLRSALQWQLGLLISTEIYQEMPAWKMPAGTLAEISPVCYSQHDTQWSRILIGTTNSIPPTQDPDGSMSGANNSIVQPTRGDYSNSSLKCTIAVSGYSPENDQYLMRVACWRK